MTTNNKFQLDEYRSYLRALADMQLNARLRGKEDVSDVVQQSLVHAHRDLDGFRGTTEAEFRSWLKSILNHTLLNLAKKYRTQKRDFRLERAIDEQLQQSAVRFGVQLEADQTSPSMQLIRQERAEQLVDAMADLLEDELTAITLKHVHGWKVAEIAEHLGRSPEAVAGLLRRGLKKLRKAMQEPPSNV